MTALHSTIAAIATPGGYGGVGIVRVSGPLAKNIAQQLLDKPVKPRFAQYSSFLDQEKNIIDTGLAIFFPNPNSFTGEDVLELQGHGGPVVLNQVLNRVITLGAEQAKPGEFSERAFLNDKIDLVQAEAIADLINASSEQAAKAAQRSLQGQFSEQINKLNEKIIHLRMYVEAAIDFPEEEIDFLNDGKVKNELEKIQETCKNILAKAQQGVILQEGIHIVLAGEPNAGKSSLLNALAQKDAAIVTDIPGTTRDVLREKINLNGIPVHIVDTAGLRVSQDLIEQEGIRRAEQEIKKADIVLHIIDSSAPATENVLKQTSEEKVLRVYNKIDLVKTNQMDEQAVYISAKTGQGFDLLTEKIFEKIGIKKINSEQISARSRHLTILKNTQAALELGANVLSSLRAGELLAEHLKDAHQMLGEITGTFTADDLLGEIFSKFCIGK
ncbi:MAG: tRNA uridine-5-carboxymethylaminomethyl(34) synthesis GTPase MnmE [Legionellales bacterium]|jgi:tRNA modification GTPase